MLVILAIAAIAILACVVLVSLGRGGELTEFPPDVPPLDLPEAGRLTAVDFMALQLPVNLVGYHTQSVDETLRRAASAISARDTRIAVLEQRVSELLSSRLHARQEVYAAPGAGLRTDHEPEAPATDRELPESGDPVSASGATVAWDTGTELRHPPDDPEWRVPEPQRSGKPAEESDAAEPEAAAGETRDEEAHDEKPRDDESRDEKPRDDGTGDDGTGDGETRDGETLADETRDVTASDAVPDDEVPGGEVVGETRNGEVAADGRDEDEPVRAVSGKDGEERA
ncbi:hypothetical protein SAMN05444920_11243 [Nonomuraea solani]|uniref:DivIVA domain-containing protein n=1 Tax=Nonomuraea solani TaxID=1144553 RepID=A0A1H6ELN9_9ACTN|nr:hypothetical protein [Nonomuraea solani]SEG98772.1 hypothetical protein SAMN05444920_11243 [Nonomuraea solani]